MSTDDHGNRDTLNVRWEKEPKLFSDAFKNLRWDLKVVLISPTPGLVQERTCSLFGFQSEQLHSLFFILGCWFELLFCLRSFDHL